MQIPLGTLTFNEGVEFAFPNQPCCNCGARQNLQQVMQDTRRTSYLIAGGTETTFQLPLPFCPRCAGSAQRRPKHIVHRILLLALSFVLSFVALLVMGESGWTPPSLARYMGYLAAVLAVLITGVVVWCARPERGQSSYFQPVRIPVLKREFISGAVTAIGFAFTNPEYAKAFAQVNADAIARKQVFVRAA